MQELELSQEASYQISHHLHYDKLYFGATYTGAPDNSQHNAKSNLESQEFKKKFDEAGIRVVEMPTEANQNICAVEIQQELMRIAYEKH